MIKEVERIIKDAKNVIDELRTENNLKRKNCIDDTSSINKK